MRRRRHRPVDLPLPGRRHAQHPGVRGGVPRRHGHRARAELPLDADDPRRRQRRHRPTTSAASPRTSGPTRARATASSATTPTTRATRPSGWPAPLADLHDGERLPLGRHGRLLPDQRPEPGGGGAPHAGRASPYKVVGGTRFYDRREIKDALAYLQGGGEPGRRGQRQAGAQRAQAGRRRHARSARLDAWATAEGVTFIEALRRADEAGVTGSGGPGHRGLRRAARRPGDARPGGSRRPAPGARSSASGYLAELEAEHTVEAAGRLENLGELVGSAREFETVGRVPRAGRAWWPTPTSSTTTRAGSC